MAIAVPSVMYWRVNMVLAHSSSSGDIMIRSMYFCDANNQKISTPCTVTSTAALYNAATYPLINILDNTNLCGFGVRNEWSPVRTINYTFSANVTPDHLYVMTDSLNPGFLWGVIPATSLGFSVWASADNITWVSFAAYVAGTITGHDVPTRMPVDLTSTSYPVPDRKLIGGSGGIYGIVSEDGIALPSRPVYLIDRDNFARIGYALTDENGGYAFNGLNENREYCVASVDPSGPPFKNALIWDRITPINTKSSIVPANAFWALRARDPALGPVVSFDRFVNGTYQLLGGNTLGANDAFWANSQLLAGTTIDIDEAAGGAIKFLRSNRTAASTGYGICVRSSMGLFSRVNASGQSANYANLTFEYVFKAPLPTESSPRMLMIWGGTRDSDDRQYGYASTWTGIGMCSGPTLEVTPTQMNVRIALGALNRTTIRASAPVVVGTIYHVIVTYKQDEYIKLYVNGVLVQTTLIPGAGRIWAHNIDRWGNAEEWDYFHGDLRGPVRRFNNFSVGGYGRNPVASGSVDPAHCIVPAGWGGGFGLAALYGRCFTDSNVADYYNSFISPETHVVTSAQSGYMAEVEADNPYYYFRLNDLSAANKPTNILGAQDYLAVWEAAPAFNVQGFVSGSTAINTTAGGLYFDGYSFINSTCTIEMFCRPTSISGTQTLVSEVTYNSTSRIHLHAVNGNVRLGVTDASGIWYALSYGFNMVVGTDYHLAVTYDPWVTKESKLFVNGVQAGLVNAPVIPYQAKNATSVWLGVGMRLSGTGTVSERFLGTLGEFALYNYVLSADRIAAHYAARNA